MKKTWIISLFLGILISLSPGAVMVEMLADGFPADYMLTPPGSFVPIDFSIAFSDPLPEFYGIVTLQGVGVLTEPTYPGIIVPPVVPEPLPENMWPLYYLPSLPVNPPQGVFASSMFEATEFGTAVINLYQTDAAFESLTLIDTLTIQVGILPEPSTLLLAAAGLLFARRRGRLTPA